VPIKSVRKHMAAAMVASAFTAPHVTEFLTCDVTATMELRDRIAARRDFAGVKVSPLVLVARAAMIAMRNTPELNATWDDAAGEVVLKHYVNLGIAAATDRGLVVPNIKDADQLSLHDLAGAIGTLSETARAGRTAPADMTGGSFTITNVGVFGVDTGTPIINPGESAILAFGAVRRMPWVVSGRGTAEGGLRPEQDMERIEPRWVTQLAVSFDHRLVDGQLGSRFLADLAAILTDPGLALL
jgi:2-oxoisovalerate dehydrogenase E2 component (dihydrolipoyl transacylase)